MSKQIVKSEVLANSLVTITQTAVGFGIGMLLANKLPRSAQRNTAIAMLSVGALTTLPLIIEAISRRVQGPTTERGMRRTLATIRDDAGLYDTGVPSDAEIF
jgi:hypothetical protein